MRRSQKAALAFFVSFLSLAAAQPAAAHAFGDRYDLPLPLWLYLAGAGATVALSFVVMVLFVRAGPPRETAFQIDLLDSPLGRLLVNPWLLTAARAVALALFVLILVAGLAGRQDTFKNIAPTLVWVIWWVGFAYVAALIGNLWALINPWKIAFTWAEAMARRLRPGARLSLGLPYPAWLGCWPAVAFFALFAWLELISGAGEMPATLAELVLIYSALTWAGMVLFGAETWLRHGEAFAVLFGILGRFAPVAVPQRDEATGTPSAWYLRPYGFGLVVRRAVSFSMTIFVVLTLATVSYDGFLETPAWSAILDWIALEPALRPTLMNLDVLGFDLLKTIETVGLAITPLLFLLVYVLFSWVMRQVSGRTHSTGEIAGLFVLSLVPIAIAYHLAHYLSYLLIAGQLIIPLASDPFGLGWNLFGTATHRIDLGIVGARFVWYTAVIAVVTGHVFAVVAAHFTSLHAFTDTRTALRSQYPLLVLMVGYTMVSLWILSQPVVETTRFG